MTKLTTREMNFLNKHTDKYGVSYELRFTHCINGNMYASDTFKVARVLDTNMPDGRYDKNQETERHSVFKEESFWTTGVCLTTSRYYGKAEFLNEICVKNENYNIYRNDTIENVVIINGYEYRTSDLMDFAKTIRKSDNVALCTFKGRIILTNGNLELMLVGTK